MTTPDTKPSCILLCPGQGAQHVGMGQAWAQQCPAAQAVFDRADAVLGLPLSKLCFEGPEDQLNRTDIAQAAIYTASVACHAVLREQGVVAQVAAAAGLSLGEFTALHLTGAFDFESGLKLVRLRGQAMQEAAEAVSSSMVALVGADEAQAVAVCDQARGSDILVPANFNAPGQVVISGSLAACERAVEVAAAMGLRPTMLKVAGAFHSPIMQPAAERLDAALQEVAWQQPGVTVVSNVTAQPHQQDLASIRQRLVDQLTSPVRWAQSMQWLIEHKPGGSSRFVELAPGKVLSGLMRRIDRAATVENYAAPAT